MIDSPPLLFRLARKSRLLPRLNFALPVASGGRTYRVPIRGGLGRGNFDGGAYDAWKRPLLTAAFTRPGAMLDVGANVGQTLLSVRAVDPDRLYVGCEPNPPCASLLEELVRLNGLKDCKIVPAGLSDRPGLLSLQDHDVMSSVASTVTGFRPEAFYTHTRCVAVLTGDAVLASLGVNQIAAIKIDVEGGELEVVKGMSKALLTQTPPLFCEILPVLEPGHAAAEITPFRTGRQEELLGLLTEYGYQAFRTLHGGGLWPLPVGDNGVPFIEPHFDLTQCDYLFLPPDRVMEFEEAAGPVPPDTAAPGPPPWAS